MGSPEGERTGEGKRAGGPCAGCHLAERAARASKRRKGATFSTLWVPRAATAGRPHWVKGQPVEEALGDNCPGGRKAKPPKSKHWLGSGQRLEPRRPLRVDGPSHKPTHAAAGQVRDHYHPREPLRTPLGEQARSLQPVAAESVGFKVLAQPVPRVEADAPGRQLLTRLGAEKHRPEVKPHGRRQQRWVPLGNHGAALGRRGATCALGAATALGIGPDPPSSLCIASGRLEALDPLHEVPHVSSLTAPKAKPSLGIAVHRKAAFGLLVEGTDALADSAPSPQLHARRLHHIFQGMAAFESHQVHLHCWLRP